MQHDPVGDLEPQAVLVGGVQPREPVGVEERSAVGRHPHLVVVHAAVERLADREQAVPGVERLVEVLLTVGSALLEVVEQVADGVGVPVELLGGQHAALLGEEQEHDAHHHRDGGLVDVVRLRR